jgi:hypothetical protein
MPRCAVTLPILAPGSADAEMVSESQLLIPMRRTITCLLLLFTLFNSSVLAANALIDVCCDLTDRGTSAYTLADNSTSDAHKAHLAHCCHVSAHYSALAQASSLIENLSTATWPRDIATRKTFLTHAPPVPPPNV